MLKTAGSAGFKRWRQPACAAAGATATHTDAPAISPPAATAPTMWGVLTGICRLCMLPAGPGPGPPPPAEVDIVPGGAGVHKVIEGLPGACAGDGGRAVQGSWG